MTPAQSMLRKATGLNLSKSIVDRAIKNRMERTDAANQDQYLEQMTPAELTALVELVVVPESWFYRDQQAFHAAAEFVRARLAADGNRLVRILTIPCAGGEEPYTMAMVLSDAGIASGSYIIDAFDISPGCVERAKSGIYGRNAFRSQDLGFRDRHFSHIGDDDYRVSEAIRKQVRIKQGNLLEFDLSARTGYYDVIFCRNLLIYFDKPTTKAAIAKLEALLANDGQLFAGYAEVPSFCQHGFSPLQYPQAFGVVKEAAATPRKPAVVAAPLRPKATAPRVALPPAPAAPPTTHVTRPAEPRASAPAAAPSPAVNLLAEARRLADLGDVKASEGKCRDHLAQHPESAEAYFILGLLNELTNKLKLAEDYWKRCIYLQPDHYEALCHLALLAEANNDAAGAAALKARAARIYKRQQA
ncbi:CheR family methyltransferase [Duganella aceris]|uniref:Protein-glutamate O-methyltransferase CheR n=1 Tax=Duganella aceris TaxID=2703883 RepID=A0ABX0FU47_9BURK|nr:protein-glutamate O-methyltransferase CheR [Duganella aceris]NGZ88226.1 protein-glutamate O-methyltransferase CheR [Duganella aceris]